MSELMQNATTSPGMELLLFGGIGIFVLLILLIVCLRTPKLGEEAKEWLEKEAKKL